MNNWRIVGYIFLGFGLIIMFYGIFYASTLSLLAESLTNTANSIIPVIPAQTPTMVFLYTVMPFAMGAAGCFVVAVVGLVAGRNKQISVVIPEVIQIKANKSKATSYFQILGYLLLGFGLVAFITGLLLGVNESFTFVPTPGSTTTARSILFSTMIPYIVTASFCWVGALVGMIAEKNKNGF